MQTPETVFRAYLQRDQLVAGGTLEPIWTPDGSGLWVVQGAPEMAELVEISLESGEVRSALDTEVIRAALTAATGHVPPYRGLPFTRFTPKNDGRVAFVYQGARWEFDPGSARLEHIGSADLFSTALGWVTDDAPVPKLWTRYDYMSSTLDVPEQLSPSGEWFASVRNYNLTVRPARSRDSGERALTQDGTDELRWDIEGLRWKMAYGKRVNFRSVSPWSPDSLTLAAYRRDLTGVFQMPRLNWLKPFEDVDTLPYHKVGAKIDRIEPVFVDVRDGRQLSVQLSETKDRFIQWLGWHREGREALLVVYRRDFKRVEIYAAERSTGATRLLLSESSPTFVKIQHDAMFSGDHGFWWLPDGSGFLWLSSRDGWNHIYHYDIGGQRVEQLTSGAWPVHDVAHIGTDAHVYFTASVDPARPYDVHVCRIPLVGGRIEQLTREQGIHAPAFSRRGQAFLDTHSSVDRPTRTDLVRSNGERLRILTEMDISRLWTVGYTPPEEFSVKAADGATDLWGVLYKPFDFDPSKQYPLIEYIYAGPQTVEAQRFFAIDSSMMSAARIPWALAQLGYIVVCLDARGTPGRSKSFHDYIYRNWNGVIPDHSAAIRALCRRHPWIDSNRVGIMGHSWGGYFATLALIQAPDTYHAAVSYAGAYDVWDAIYYEPYLGSPLDSREPYDQADILQQARHIRGPLMFSVGTSDYVIVAGAMKMSWALIEAGVDHDFVVIPQAYHQYVGAEERYFLMKATRWLDRHVKNKGRDPL